jgi:hypothetical protein
MEPPTENLRAKLATPSNHVVNFKSKKKKKRITFLVRLQLPTVEIS